MVLIVFLLTFPSRFAAEYWTSIAINLELLSHMSYNVVPSLKVCLTISSWLVVALAIDRLLLIRFPHKASRINTAKNAYIITVIIVILSIAVTYGLAVEHYDTNYIASQCRVTSVVPKQTNRTDGSVYVPLAHQASYRIPQTAFILLARYIVPAIIVVVCNCKFKSLVKSRKRVGNASRSTALENRLSKSRITKMITVVSVMFLVFNLPHNFLIVVFKFLQPTARDACLTLAQFSIAINTSCNILIYSFFNKKLFSTILQIFGKCKNKNEHVLGRNTKLSAKSVTVSTIKVNSC